MRNQDGYESTLYFGDFSVVAVFGVEMNDSEHEWLPDQNIATKSTLECFACDNIGNETNILAHGHVLTR